MSVSVFFVRSMRAVALFVLLLMAGCQSPAGLSAEELSARGRALYDSGHPLRAADYFERAARMGDAPAMQYLASYYENGVQLRNRRHWFARWMRDWTRDPDKARYWSDRLVATLRERADRGDADAMAVLAISYRSEYRVAGLTGADADTTQFAFWAERAARAGSIVGKRLYGNHLAAMGRQDEAAALWLEAGEAGDPFSLLRWSSVVLRDEEVDLRRYYEVVRTMLERHPETVAVWMNGHLSGLERGADQRIALSMRHLAYIDSLGIREDLRNLPPAPADLGKWYFPLR
ncbi:MAG: hypothetical protein R2834_05735 [Rhodothermales bacterium]